MKDRERQMETDDVDLIWEPFPSPESADRLKFEEVLSELAGVPSSLSHLDVSSRKAADTSAITPGLSTTIKRM